MIAKELAAAGNWSRPPIKDNVDIRWAWASVSARSSRRSAATRVRATSSLATSELLLIECDDPGVLHDIDRREDLAPPAAGDCA